MKHFWVREIASATRKFLDGGRPSRRERGFRCGVEALDRREVPATLAPFQVAAAAVGSDTTFVLFPGGVLDEHTGTNSATGWIPLIGGNVSQISAGLDGSGKNAVFALLDNGSLYEVSSRGTYFLGSGISKISASQVQGDTVFAILDNGWVDEHVGTASNQGWTILSKAQFSQISAGRDQTGRASVWAVDRAGDLIEFTSTGPLATSTTWSTAGGIAQISASQVQDGSVFVLYNNGALYNLVALSNIGESWKLLAAQDVTSISAGRSSYSGLASVFFTMLDPNIRINGAAESLLQEDTPSGVYDIGEDEFLSPESGSQSQANTDFEEADNPIRRGSPLTVTLSEHVGTSISSGTHVITTAL